MRNQVSISSIVIVLLVSLLSAGSAFSAVVINVTSPKEGFDIEADTTYNLQLNGLVPGAISNGVLTVTEHWGDFNNAAPVGTVSQLEYVNIWIDGIGILNLDSTTNSGPGSLTVSAPLAVTPGTNIVYFNDNEENTREVTLGFTLTQAEMNSVILVGGSAIVHVYTSIDVDNSRGIDGSQDDSWFEATISYEVIPEPATMMLFGLGGVLLRRRKKA